MKPDVEGYAVRRALPRDFWLAAGANGPFGLEIPEEYGGLAQEYRLNAVVTEELSRVNAALASCWGIHADVTAPYIVELGTEEQKQRCPPRAAEGPQDQDLLLAPVGR